MQSIRQKGQAMRKLNWYGGVVLAGASAGAAGIGHYDIAIMLGLWSIGEWLDGVCRAMKKPDC
jgi:hypothetical protein